MSKITNDGLNRLAQDAYSCCTHMTAVSVKGLNTNTVINDDSVSLYDYDMRIRACLPAAGISIEILHQSVTNCYLQFRKVC